MHQPGVAISGLCQDSAGCSQEVPFRLELDTGLVCLMEKKILNERYSVRDRSYFFRFSRQADGERQGRPVTSGSGLFCGHFSGAAF
jgi:hypothetical protein